MDAAGGDQADYRQKLQQIRLVYNEELRKYEEVGFLRYCLCKVTRFFFNITIYSSQILSLFQDICIRFSSRHVMNLPSM